MGSQEMLVTLSIPFIPPINSRLFLVGQIHILSYFTELFLKLEFVRTFLS